MMGACALALSWWRVAGMLLLVGLFAFVQMAIIKGTIGRATDDYGKEREMRAGFGLALLNALLVALAWLGAQDYYCG